METKGQEAGGICTDTEQRDKADTRQSWGDAAMPATHDAAVALFCCCCCTITIEILAVIIPPWL